MKKIVTFLMVVAMLASMCAIGVSAEQTNMEVTIPKFTAQPTFDGCVTEEEWGAKTLRMVTDGAATTEDTEIGVNEEYGLKNTYYYFALEGICDTLAYDLWLRWDDQYLYLAAIVEDPDPFSLPSGGEEIWNGDCLQLRVDEKGPSASMLPNNPNFNYKTDAFNGNRFKKPWSSDAEVFNSIIGLVKGDTPTIWRCGKTYGEGWNLKDEGGIVGITCVQNDDDTCTTTYEAAYPWSSVNATLVPKAGDTYGVGVAVACSDSNELNGCLQWGSGIMFADEQPRGTRGGSQAMILGADEVTPAENYAVATEPAETEDEPALTLPPVATGNEGAETDDVKATNDNNETKNEDNKPTTPTDNDKDEDDGIPVYVWIIIAVAAVAVVVVVVVVIKKKKN